MWLLVLRVAGRVSGRGGRQKTAAWECDSAAHPAVTRISRAIGVSKVRCSA
jgi:hypothetical protein